MINCGNLIDIDGLEQQICKKHNISNNDRFNIILNGQYKNKCCIITIENKIPISFYSDSWEKLYYIIKETYG